MHATNAILRPNDSATVGMRGDELRIRTPSSASSDTSLGRGESVIHRVGRTFCGFTPAVSPSALKAMRETIRDLNIRQQTQLAVVDIADRPNPLLRGWIEYYGRYTPSALSTMLRYVNQTLLRWVMRKFKRFKARKVRASHFLQELVRDGMGHFVHWRIGMTGPFA